jgi:hypothetical protein
MWRAETHNGAMYVGTNDSSSSWQDPRLAPIPALLAPEFGFDIWGTCDGQYWWEVTRNAFGDGRWNFGARSLVSTPFGLFIGSTNHIEGTSVWKGDASPCGTGGGGGQFGLVKRAAADSGSGASLDTGSAASRAALVSPRRLITDSQPCGTALTWDASPGASRYRILRADYRSAVVNVALTPQLGPDAMPTPAPPGTPGKKKQIWVAGRYVSIGTTTKPSFVDRTAKQDGRYNYEVVAIDASGHASMPSNVATAPSQAPKVTFVDLNTAVTRLAATASRTPAAQLLRLATAARTSWSANRAASLRVLAQLGDVVDATSTRHAAGPAAKYDVRDAIFRLERLAKAKAACGA